MAVGSLNWAFPAGQISRVWSRVRPIVVVEAPPRKGPVVHHGTPEIYFSKTIDNSRLVRVADPARTREMRMFSIACLALFAVMMLYAWQHFSAIEYGYRINKEKAQRDSLVEMNRELRLEEAALRDPERIDKLARRLGMQSAQVGQVSSLDQPEAAPEPSTAVIASAAPVSGLAAR
jgi:cell division protein FtsL